MADEGGCHGKQQPPICLELSDATWTDSPIDFECCGNEAGGTVSSDHVIQEILEGASGSIPEPMTTMPAPSHPYHTTPEPECSIRELMCAAASAEHDGRDAPRKRSSSPPQASCSNERLQSTPAHLQHVLLAPAAESACVNTSLDCIDGQEVFSCCNKRTRAGKVVCSVCSRVFHGACQRISKTRIQKISKGSKFECTSCMLASIEDSALTHPPLQGDAPKWRNSEENVYCSFANSGFVGVRLTLNRIELDERLARQNVFLEENYDTIKTGLCPLGVVVEDERGSSGCITCHRVSSSSGEDEGPEEFSVATAVPKVVTKSESFNDCDPHPVRSADNDMVVERRRGRRKGSLSPADQLTEEPRNLFEQALTSTPKKHRKSQASIQKRQRLIPEEPVKKVSIPSLTSPESTLVEPCEQFRRDCMARMSALFRSQRSELRLDVSEEAARKLILRIERELYRECLRSGESATLAVKYDEKSRSLFALLSDKGKRVFKRLANSKMKVSSVTKLALEMEPRSEPVCDEGERADFCDPAYLGLVKRPRVSLVQTGKLCATGKPNETQNRVSEWLHKSSGQSDWNLDSKSDLTDSSTSSSAKTAAEKVWRGELILDGKKLPINGVHLNVDGNADSCFGIPPQLEISGRISSEKVWNNAKFACQHQKLCRYSVLRLQPSKTTDRGLYNKIFDYLRKRDRSGMVKSKFPNREIFVLPYRVQDEVPECFSGVENSLDCGDDSSLLCFIIQMNAISKFSPIKRDADPAAAAAAAEQKSVRRLAGIAGNLDVEDVLHMVATDIEQKKSPPQQLPLTTTHKYHSSILQRAAIAGTSPPRGEDVVFPDLSADPFLHTAAAAAEDEDDFPENVEFTPPVPTTEQPASESTPTSVTSSVLPPLPLPPPLPPPLSEREAPNVSQTDATVPPESVTSSPLEEMLKLIPLESQIVLIDPRRRFNPDRLDRKVEFFHLLGWAAVALSKPRKDSDVDSERNELSEIPVDEIELSTSHTPRIIPLASESPAVTEPPLPPPPLPCPPLMDAIISRPTQPPTLENSIPITTERPPWIDSGPYGSGESRQGVHDAPLPQYPCEPCGGSEQDWTGDAPYTQAEYDSSHAVTQQDELDAAVDMMQQQTYEYSTSEQIAAPSTFNDPGSFLPPAFLPPAPRPIFMRAGSMVPFPRPPNWRQPMRAPAADHFRPRHHLPRPVTVPPFFEGRPSPMVGPWRNPPPGTTNHPSAFNTQRPQLRPRFPTQSHQKYHLPPLRTPRSNSWYPRQGRGAFRCRFGFQNQSAPRSFHAQCPPRAALNVSGMPGLRIEQACGQQSPWPRVPRPNNLSRHSGNWAPGPSGHVSQPPPPRIPVAARSDCSSSHLSSASDGTPADGGDAPSTTSPAPAVVRGGGCDGPETAAKCNAHVRHSNTEFSRASDSTDHDEKVARKRAHQRERHRRESSSSDDSLGGLRRKRRSRNSTDMGHEKFSGRPRTSKSPHKGHTSRSADREKRGHDHSKTHHKRERRRSRSRERRDGHHSRDEGVRRDGDVVMRQLPVAGARFPDEIPPAGPSARETERVDIRTATRCSVVQSTRKSSPSEIEDGELPD